MFNKIIGDSYLELQFAAFLEDCDDIISYVKNYFSVHFKIDYVNASGEISNYYPDFIVKKSKKETCIIETKGLKDLDVPLKMERLRQWCIDINKAQSEISITILFSWTRKALSGISRRALVNWLMDSRNTRIRLIQDNVLGT